MAPYYGDNRKRHRIVFERDSNMGCVFCWQKADTREHIPAKVFLIAPYPTNLQVIPSCEKCNNSYSKDELYSALLLELLKEKYVENYIISENSLQRLEKYKEGNEAKVKVEELIQSDSVFNDSRLEHVIEKFAICHAVHDFSGDFNIKSKRSIRYKILPDMTSEEIDAMDQIEPLEILPEVGSIGYENIFVLDYKVQSESGEIYSIPVGIFANWNDVQENNYRYICFIERGRINVKLVIGEFLFAHIIFGNRIKKR